MSHPQLTTYQQQIRVYSSYSHGGWITLLYSATWTSIPFFNRLFLYLLQNFAKEFVISDHKELDEDYIKNELKKAGGANYDAQTE